MQMKSIKIFLSFNFKYMFYGVDRIRQAEKFINFTPSSSVTTELNIIVNNQLLAA